MSFKSSNKLLLVFLLALFLQAESGKCPSSHPYVYYNGQYCCASTKEKVYVPQGDKCDGSSISRSSLCCEGDSFVRCPSGHCDSGTCPISHPFVYYNGLYCCASTKEKVYGPQGDKCDGSTISRSSLCCEGDSFVRCPSGHCEGTGFERMWGWYLITNNNCHAILISSNSGVFTVFWDCISGKSPRSSCIDFPKKIS